MAGRVWACTRPLQSVNNSDCHRWTRCHLTPDSFACYAPCCPRHCKLIVNPFTVPHLAVRNTPAAHQRFLCTICSAPLLCTSVICCSLCRTLLSGRLQASKAFLGALFTCVMNHVNERDGQFVSGDVFGHELLRLDFLPAGGRLTHSFALVAYSSMRVFP